MDKSWMQLNNRWSTEYVQGVKNFLNFSNASVDKANRMRCPCRDFNNVYFKTVEVVETHLLMRGIDRQYTQWIHHGEVQTPLNNPHDDALLNDIDVDNVDEVQEIIEDIHRGNFTNNFVEEPSGDDEPSHRENDTDKFARLWRDAQNTLYPGCDKFSKLSFIIKLLHIKTMNRWRNKSFNQVLNLFKEALPTGETLTKSHYEAKTMIRDLGLGYVPIHACKNDCVLFWKEHEKKQECPNCGESRWIFKDDNKKKKIPQKVLRHFPLKQRLQRLFMSKNTAEDMKWHKQKRVVEDNVSRHPADSEVWKEFDKEHEWFAQDPRNVRLGLAIDGFNPFGNMSTSYSMWPVVLMSYNLPPWKCMKERFFMMSLLIPGPKSPGNDIDVYLHPLILHPLIEELKELWETGVDTYDAATNETFRLHVAVLWTINDFPAYASLSGWSTKGKLACSN